VSQNNTMARRKLKVRKKGKLPLSRYFQKIEDGAKVAVAANRGVRAAFPLRIQGQTGNVSGSRGTFKLVEIKDGNKMKTFIIHPIHLRQI